MFFEMFSNVRRANELQRVRQNDPSPVDVCFVKATDVPNEANAFTRKGVRPWLAHKSIFYGGLHGRLPVQDHEKFSNAFVDVTCSAINSCLLSFCQADWIASVTAAGNIGFVAGVGLRFVGGYDSIGSSIGSTTNDRA